MSSSMPLLSVRLVREEDILLARQRARVIAQAVGFSGSDITRITTALSEIARNTLEYVGKGSVIFSVDSSPDAQELTIRVTDDGAGISDLAAVLAPGFKSKTGMGIGIKGSRALMDRFEITSVPGEGTTVVMGKRLPWSATAFAMADAARLTQRLAVVTDASPVGELQIQNQSLLNALQELTDRQAEIQRLVAVAEAARERAEAAQLVAERSVVVRDRFMALTTHELRSPLNAIIGYLELLEMQLASSMNEKQKDYFMRVQRASKHLLGVTNDFLDMAQGDAGRLKVARKTGSAGDVMREAAALVTPQAAAQDVTVNLSETTKDISYFGDAARARQILVNLLGNAVSFTPRGGTVQVVASRETAADFEGGDAGSWCAIRVTDSGPGIPADKLPQVFEPFVQLTGKGQSTRQGSGLGLTVSRQLALLMGGELTAASRESGAQFTLWMPEHPTPEAPVSGGRYLAQHADADIHTRAAASESH